MISDRADQNRGVSSSIEDAAALELFLDNLPSSLSVESPASDVLSQRLQQFEKFRLGRVSATQILTEPVIPGPQAMENYKKQEALIRQYYDGPLPPTGSVPHSPGICQFFFGYDVRKEAQQFLEANPLTTLSSTLSSTPAPVAIAAQQNVPTQANVDAQKIVLEAQNALVQAQAALVQVTQTLAAAQRALELATKNLQFSQSQPSTAPSSTAVSTASSSAPEPQQAPVAASRPAQPKKRASFESLKNRMTGMFGGAQNKSGLVSVKEVAPDTPPNGETQQLTNDVKAH